MTSHHLLCQMNLVPMRHNSLGAKKTCCGEEDEKGVARVLENCQFHGPVGKEHGFSPHIRPSVIM